VVRVRADAPRPEVDLALVEPVVRAPVERAVVLLEFAAARGVEGFARVGFFGSDGAFSSEVGSLSGSSGVGSSSGGVSGSELMWPP